VLDEQLDINVRTVVTTHQPILSCRLDISFHYLVLFCINEIKVFHVKNSIADKMAVVFYISIRFIIRNCGYQFIFYVFDPKVHVEEFILLDERVKNR
jgi:hypothetical protein